MKLEIRENYQKVLFLDNEPKVCLLCEQEITNEVMYYDPSRKGLICFPCVKNPHTRIETDLFKVDRVEMEK